jgi:hypothetical protein
MMLFHLWDLHLVKTCKTFNLFRKYEIISLLKQTSNTQYFNEGTGIYNISRYQNTETQ